MKKIIFIFLFLSTSIFNHEINTYKITADTKKQSPKESQDIVGRIKIENTNINYDLVQTTDNEYYLNHNPKKQEDPKGSIFIDYRNNLTDQKLLIYGHNSKYDTAPFKELENYLDYNYLLNNNKILITLKNKTYLYKIFSIMTVEMGDYRHTKINFTNNEYQEHLTWLKNNSIYDIPISVTTTDKIITIQTCYYHPNNSYLLINIKRDI